MSAILSGSGRTSAHQGHRGRHTGPVARWRHPLQPCRPANENGATERAIAPSPSRRIDPAARCEWVQPGALGGLGDQALYYLADGTLSHHARLRLRSGFGAYSLCGVTHTTASLGMMNELKGVLREAVAPWDALICTSTSVVETIRRVLAAESD